MTATYTLSLGNFLEGTLRSLSTVCTGDETSSSLPANATQYHDGKTVPATALSIDGLGAVDILVEATTGTFSSGATLQAYHFDPKQRVWARWPSMDRNVSEGVAAHRCEPLEVKNRLGWLVYLPVGLGVGCTITLNGRAVRVGA